MGYCSRLILVVNFRLMGVDIFFPDLSRGSRDVMDENSLHFLTLMNKMDDRIKEYQMVII